MTSMTTPAMQPTTMAAIILPSRPPSHDPSSHSDPVSGITTTLRHTQTKHHITTLLPVNMLICIVRYGTIRLLRLHSFRKISPPLPFSLSVRSSVWLSICLSHSGIVGYRNCLIILLSSVYGSPHRSSFPTTQRLYEIPTGSLHTGTVNVGGVYIYLAIFWLSQLHFKFMVTANICLKFFLLVHEYAEIDKPLSTVLILDIHPDVIREKQYQVPLWDCFTSLIVNVDVPFVPFTLQQTGVV